MSAPGCSHADCVPPRLDASTLWSSKRCRLFAPRNQWIEVENIHNLHISQKWIEMLGQDLYSWWIFCVKDWFTSASWIFQDLPGSQAKGSINGDGSFKVFVFVGSLLRKAAVSGWFCSWIFIGRDSRESWSSWSSMSSSWSHNPCNYWSDESSWDMTNHHGKHLPWITQHSTGDIQSIIEGIPTDTNQIFWLHRRSWVQQRERAGHRTAAGRVIGLARRG